MRTGTLSLLLLAVGSCWAQMPVVPTERTPPTDPAKAEPNETEAAAKAEEARKVQAEYGRKKYDELPDFGEADVNKRLRCSACVASVHEIMASLRDLEGTKGKKYTKSYHMVEVLDDVCLDKVGKEYGLLLKSNKPTERFSKDKSIARASGSWVQTKSTTICGEVYQEYDDDVKALWDMRHIEDFVNYKTICLDKFGYCTPATLEILGKPPSFAKPDADDKPPPIDASVSMEL